VRFLIEREVNLNHCNGKNVTPFALAKRENHKAIIKLLLDAGCSSHEEEVAF